MARCAHVYVKSPLADAELAGRVAGAVGASLERSESENWGFSVDDTFCMLIELAPTARWNPPVAAGYSAEILIDEPGGPGSSEKLIEVARTVCRRLLVAGFDDVRATGWSDDVLEEHHPAHRAA